MFVLTLGTVAAIGIITTLIALIALVISFDKDEGFPG